MAFTEICMLFLACAILALVYILASILQEHRIELATRASRAPHPSVRNALPRHPDPDGRTNLTGTAHVVAPGPAGLRVRFRSPTLPSVADALLSGINNLADSTLSRSRQVNTTGVANGTIAARPTAHISQTISPAGPSTARTALAAGPSTSHTPIAGPSTPRRPLTTAVGPSRAQEALSGSTVGASVPWSPKKGWTSTCRVNGIPYHRTEKKMRPRKSLKAGSEEPELIITPYWEPENIATRLIDSPPDLSGDPNLTVDDIFIFHTAIHYRLWIYRAGGFWERIEVGFQREDGRFLIVTPVKKEPSWVSRDYFERQTTRQAESDSD